MEICLVDAQGSDKTWSYHWSFVRRCLCFRQNKVVSLEFCLKIPSVKTQRGHVIGVLSEDAHGSDKTRSCHWSFVRRCLGFRQNKVVSLEFCPKMPRVQTKQGRVIGVLSEGAEGSDKTRSCHWSFVRRCPWFRQNKVVSLEFCPKIPMVQTKRGHVIGVLSEGA